jgi:predicted RNA-binding protein
MCTYAAPFGVVPQEIDEVFPLSQYEIAIPFDNETLAYTAKQVSNYIEATQYEKVVLLQDVKMWKGKVETACRQACMKKRIFFLVLPLGKTTDQDST